MDCDIDIMTLMIDNHPMVREDAATDELVCPCGARFTINDSTAVPADVLACPACWGTYHRVLQRLRNDEALIAYVPLVVDTYALQHIVPGDTVKAGLHLCSLGLFTAGGHLPAPNPVVMKRLSELSGEFTNLRAPNMPGAVTIADVANAASLPDTVCTIWDWAMGVWDAWVADHGRVDSWLAKAGLHQLP